MQLVCIRELKNKLTYYLGKVKKGNIIITDRGTPVAIMRNFNTTEADAGVEERMAFFAKQGFLSLPKSRGTFDSFKRVKAGFGIKAYTP
jgi:hypothetical protein